MLKDSVYKKVSYLSYQQDVLFSPYRTKCVRIYFENRLFVTRMCPVFRTDNFVCKLPFVCLFIVQLILVLKINFAYHYTILIKMSAFKSLTSHRSSTLFNLFTTFHVQFLNVDLRHCYSVFKRVV